MGLFLPVCVDFRGRRTILRNHSLLYVARAFVAGWEELIHFEDCVDLNRSATTLLLQNEQISHKLQTATGCDACERIVLSS